MSKPRQIPPGERNLVGHKVAKLRKQRGMKQKALAAELQRMGMDICETSLSKLEGRRLLVQDFEVVLLAKALDVSVEWLLCGDDECAAQTDDR